MRHRRHLYRLEIEYILYSIVENFPIVFTKTTKNARNVVLPTSWPYMLRSQNRWCFYCCIKCLKPKRKNKYLIRFLYLLNRCIKSVVNIIFFTHVDWVKPSKIVLFIKMYFLRNIRFNEDTYLSFLVYYIFYERA